MAGHSPWANIKHRKEKQDAQKGKIYTKCSREIIVAAKHGGGDPAGNARLRAAIETAKKVGVPNANIERAIEKGVGGGDSSQLDEVIYEGYAPGGIAVMVQALTDNRNRTAANIRSIFTKQGGSLGATGCVAYLFHKKGLITIKKGSGINEDDLILTALDLGAEDVQSRQGEFFEITSPFEEFYGLKAGLEEKGYTIEDGAITMIPDTKVELLEPETARQVLKLMEAIENDDDVQETYANFDLSPALMEKIGTWDEKEKL